MNILSLFDGMSCGQIALRELGVEVSRYYASEIDRHAIGQTILNFPETIFLGDVEAWQEWSLDWSSIDLVLAGSPCQGFSRAGARRGFEDERSRLFWVFVDILEHTRLHNPEVRWLLENVRMDKYSEQTISDALGGVMPVEINSALVSAQNRVRLYWSNIRVSTEGLFGDRYTDIPQPSDRGIYLRDILDAEVDKRYYITPKKHGAWGQSINGKGWSLRVGGRGCASHKHAHDVIALPTAIPDTDSVLVAMRGRVVDGKVQQVIEPQHSGKSNCLTSVTKDNLLLCDPRVAKNYREDSDKAGALLATAYKGCRSNGMTVVAGTWRTHKVDGGFRAMQGNKAPCIPARARNDGSGQPCVQQEDMRLRRLTPRECARLQTIPNWYQWACSDTQAYKMLGNGWTVEVIKHILSYLTINKDNGKVQSKI